MSDDSDDDRSRRATTREVGGTLTHSLPTTAAEAHATVMQFIKDVQPRHIRSKQKEHITTFAKW